MTTLKWRQMTHEEIKALYTRCGHVVRFDDAGYVLIYNPYTDQWDQDQHFLEFCIDDA